VSAEKHTPDARVPDARVFEENLARLLRESYVPALPRPAIRSRLEATWREEVGRRAEKRGQLRPVAGPSAPGAPGTSGWKRTATALLAAAAVVLAAFVGFELVDRGGMREPDRGRIADEEGRRELAPAPASSAAGNGPTVALEEDAERDAREVSQRSLAEPSVAAGEDEDGSGDADEAAAIGDGLALRVVDAESGEAIAAYRVGLLPPRRGNEFDLSVVRDVAASDGHGRWSGHGLEEADVFVHAEGYALFSGERSSFAEDALTDLGEIALVRGGEVRGHVVDERGNGIPGATVLSQRDAPTWALPFDLDQMEQWLPVRSTTAEDGSFVLSHLSPGTHVLRANAPGRAPGWSSRIEVTEGGRVEGVTLTLDEGATVAGRVERDDGSAHAGAWIVFSSMNETSSNQIQFARTTCDAEGRYEIGGLPASELLAILIGDGFGPPKVVPVRARSGETTTLDFLAKREGTRLVGRLLDADGTPIGRQNMGLFDEASASPDEGWIATTTSPSGRFGFEAIDPGRYVVMMVGDANALKLVGRVELPDSPEVERDLRLGPHRIEGTARIAFDGSPVAGALLVLEVVADDGRRIFAGMANTDEEGAFVVEGLPAETYRLTLYPADRSLGFEIAPPLVVDERTPSVRHDFLHGPGGAMAVTVTDREGRPLRGARIEFVDRENNVFTFERFPVTGADGVHRAQGVRPGPYRVDVSLEGYEPASVGTECRAGQTRTLRVELRGSNDEEARESER